MPPPPASAEAIARTLGGERAPVRATGVEQFGAVPGSGYRRPPALVRRSDGQVVQLTPLLDAVLRELADGRTYDEVADGVRARTGRALEASDVAFLLEHKLRPLGLLRDADGGEPRLTRANPLLALRCRIVISDPAVTRRLTGPFAALFRPPVVVAVLAAFALSTGWLLFDRGLATATHAAFSEPHLLLAVFGLTVLSAGFHEFGHAAACRYSGATPGVMGAGLYLVWPAFYTDVTDSYRLGRAGRLRVDLGGLYFNAVFAVVAVGVWAATGLEALLLLVASQLLQMLRQLVPLVRFDGYHILADLIGVPDLFAHLGPTLRGLLPSRWRGDLGEPALRRWAQVVVRLWVAVVVPVLAVVLVLLVVALPRVAATAWESLVLQWEVLGRNWADRAIADVGVRLLSIAALLIPVLSAVYLLARIVRRVVRRVAALTAGSRRRRLAAWAGGTVLAAAIAAAWWSPGGFAPIEPADGSGRVQDGLPFIAAGFDGDVGRSAPDRSEPEVVASGAAPTTPAAPADEPVQPVAREAPADRRERRPAVVEPVTVTLAAEEPATERRGPVAGARPEWPFPWDRPAPVRPGDDRAMVVNTEDGATRRDVSLSYVWLDGEEPVDTRNEAFAFASCTDCTSIAAAFQVVFLTDQAEVVTPANSAVAANYACERCVTHAVAEQLVVTLVDRPDGRTRGALHRILADLRAFTAVPRTSGELLDAFRAARADVLQVLGDAVVTSEAAEDADASADDPDDGSTDDDPADDSPEGAADGSVDDAAEGGSDEAADRPDAAPADDDPADGDRADADPADEDAADQDPDEDPADEDAAEEDPADEGADGDPADEDPADDAADGSGDDADEGGGDGTADGLDEDAEAGDVSQDGEPADADDGAADEG